MTDAFVPGPGPRNLITDVPGLRVGHAHDPAVRTGVTVLLPDRDCPASVDARGGGPGLRETEALAPENLVGRLHALVFAGGSVFGLAAADGVARALSQAGRGLHITPGTPPIPIVPAAVLHDLANGGDKNWGPEPPYCRLGQAAVGACDETFALGPVGAGLGARCGTGPGGVGSASLELGEGVVVGALAVVNSVGTSVMPDGVTSWAWPWELAGEFGGHRPAPDLPPDPDPLARLSRLPGMGRLAPGAATTLACVAVSAELSTAECKRLAIMAQDGLARALRPVHTPFDGDVVFALALGGAALSPERSRAWHVARLGTAASDTLARAVARGVWEARRAASASG